MQQTLLTLLALLVATLLSFNQKQAGIQNERQVVQGELEQMALGVAAESMQIIRARAFDSADSIESTGDLTEEGAFPSGNRCQPFFSDSAAACDALEDFHEMEPAVTDFGFPEGRFQFKVTEVDVRYVDENFSPASSPTYQKKVVLKIQDDPSDGGTPRLPTPIIYSEVVSYP